MGPRRDPRKTRGSRPWGASAQVIRLIPVVLCYPDISVFDEDSDIAVIALNIDIMQAKCETIS